MAQVKELANEIAAAIEIFFFGRGQQYYNNAAFILCDDYTELASKLFLLADNEQWSDRDSDKMADYLMAKQEVETAARTVGQTASATAQQVYSRGEPKGRSKNYHAVLKDVADVFTAKRPADLPQLSELQRALTDRRKSRNNLVHTSGPLGMQVSSANCIEALCELMAYAELLFGADWSSAKQSARGLETYSLLLELERIALKRHTLRFEIDAVFSRRRRQDTKPPPSGAQVLRHGHDLYTGYCIWLDSDNTLKTALQVLYRTATVPPRTAI